MLSVKVRRAVNKLSVMVMRNNLSVKVTRAVNNLSVKLARTVRIYQ